MSDDLRTRLRDLASEMPPLHAPADLEARARRREVRMIAIVSAAAILVAIGAWGGIRSIDLSRETIPGGVPFPLQDAPIASADALLQAPEGLTIDASGNLLISEWYGNRLDLLTPGGSFGVIAGTGTPGYEGDGGSAVDASMDSPTAMAIQADGSMLFVDNGNHCIRRIDLAGLITRVAGTCGTGGFDGEGTPALDALLSHPIGLALDPAGGFYLSDNDRGLVRHVDADGVITTIAGGGTVSPIEAGPDGVEASSLDLGRTSYVLLDLEGNLYVSDLRLNAVVRIDPKGIGTVVAGTGAAGYSGDGGPATEARLNFPSGLAMDAAGELFISDTDNSVIRMVDADGIIHTVAGDGSPGQGGDGGPATSARLAGPAGLAFDASGSLFIADQQNDRIRRVDPDGTITTVAGA